MLVVPPATRSAIRRVATTWTHQGVQRSLNSLRFTRSCSGIRAPSETMPAAIANAVYDAVGARVTQLPITAERVYDAMREQPS